MRERERERERETHTDREGETERETHADRERERERERDRRGERELLLYLQNNNLSHGVLHGKEKNVHEVFMALLKVHLHSQSDSFRQGKDPCTGMFIYKTQSVMEMNGVLGHDSTL